MFTILCFQNWYPDLWCVWPVWVCWHHWHPWETQTASLRAIQGGPGTATKLNLKIAKKIAFCFCRWTWRSCTMNSSECSLTMKGKTIHKPMMQLKLLAKLRDTKNLLTNCKGRLNIWKNSNCTTCIYFLHLKVFESKIHWGHWRAQQTTSQHY